jgi:hypothetical protein
VRRRNLSSLEDTELLKLRFCDLGLKLERSAIGADLGDLYAALKRRGITFRPHVWLSTEWFSPDGIPGIAVPFYTAHPHLMRLERRMKGEAEGGSRFWRQRILRHEAGHALDTAYALRRRPGWRDTFGRASKPYPNTYSVRPASRRFVQHLGHWYAQSHPTEDFAETFAVWLQPKARWRREYAGWPALGKLEFVDRLMTDIAGRRPRNSDRSTAAPLHNNQRSLREHYRRNQLPDDRSDSRYDPWLLQTFTNRTRNPGARPASAFLREFEAGLAKAVMQRTGAGRYLFQHVALTLRRRARQLGLVLRHDRRDARNKAINLHRRVILDLLQRNRERYVL